MVKLFDSSFKEILSTQVICLIGGLIVGTILAIYTDKILLIPGMFILLPGFLEMRGNISGSFASRLSCGLFLGVVKPDKTAAKIIKGNLIASFLLALFVSFILGIIAFTFSYLILGEYTPEIIVITVIAGLIANSIEILITLFATFYVFKKGHDPNNIMGPFVTTTGDITNMLSLLVTMVVLI